MMVEVMFCVCNTICMILIGEWTYHWTVTKPKKFIFASVLFVSALLFRFVLFPELFGIYYILEFFAWFLVCQGTWIRKLLNMTMLYFATGYVSGLIEILIDILLGGKLGSAGRDFLCIGIVALVFYLMSRFHGYQSVVRYVNSITVEKYFCILILFIFGTVIIVVGSILHEELNENILTTIFRIAIAIEFVAILSITIWLANENYQRKLYYEKNLLKDEVIQAQKAYYEVLCEKDREMRSFRHDISSQIGILQMLLERDDVAGAKAHLNRIQQEFEQASFQKICVGEERLDAILSMMNQRALNSGVQLEIIGKLEHGIEHDVFDFCAIFSNAISNAIEACKNLEDDRNVEVKLLNHNQTLCCRFENPATEEMYQNILSEETSKVNKDEHGYGVRNIRNAVERLKGSMEYQYQDGKVILEICI